jgi:gliding motility-associated-like protein
MVSDPPPYCQGATAVELTADIVPGNIINWYSPGSVVPSGPTGPTPSTSTVGSVTYYVSQTTSTEGCESQRAPIVVTVSTTPFIADKTLTNCSEAAISFTPSEAPIGTQYTWATPLIVPSGAIFGATGQTSPTNSFTQSLRNLTNVNATSEYIITPSVGTCPGPDFNILVTVEPKAFIADETINAICSGESINFTPTTSGSNIIPSNTLYKWTVVSIIPAGSIINATSQTIPSASLSQTLTNISSVTARIVYAITPVSGNCTGPAFTLTVDVNPKPKIQDIPLTICSGQTFNAVILNNPPGIIVPAATSYTWPTPTSTGPNAISGGSAQLIGSSFISQTLVNSTISTQTLTYIVTPTTGSCSGPNFRVIVTVNPQPNIAPKKEIVCSGTAFSIVPSDAPIGTLYTWTIPTVEAPGNISGAIAQTSPVSTISQLLTNNKNYPAKVTYNVSPSSGSCGGSGFSVEIIVNPKPFIPTLKDTICNGEIFSIIPVNGVSSAIVPDLTTYTWVLPTSLPNGTITGGSAQPTSQTSIQQTLFNASDAPGILNYRVTPVSGSFGNCPGPVFSVSVMVNPDAKARFTPTDTIGCPPYLINANRVGLQQFTQRNNEYIWYIDGQLNGTGTGLPNFKILNEDDTIQLKLVTTSLYGCKSDSAFKKFITYKLPHPEFSVSENDDCGPYTVSFVNNTPDKQVFRYNWTFGNGLTSSKSDPDPVQFLPNPSFGDTIYTVRLDVTSVCNIVSYEQKIRVKSKPKALFSPTSTIGCSPFKVVFNNTSRGVNNRYVWDFGDGRKDSVLIRDTISHIYYTSVRDTFIVKLYAINECGIDSSSYNIIVSPNTIKLDFAVNGEEKEGCIQHTVRFINNTSGASAFRWNFGDGNTRSTIKNIDTVSHTYLQPGKYTITLFATNGCTDTLSTEEVTVYGLPTPDFGVSKFNVCIGDSIFFKNKSTNADSYLWDLGDGKRVTFVDPGHRYANKGTYQVKLFVFKTNSPGIVCVDSIVRTINIVDTVNVAFDVSDSVSNCAPFRVVFNNFYRDNIYAEWNFGDGIKLRGDSVTHIFNKTGRFDVKLYVKAIGGCNYIGSKPITINSPTGTASFKSGYSCIDESIRFEAIPFATDSILWDFGDGILLKTDKRVVYHQYQNPGVYVPTITLLSNLGCAFKVDISDTIKIDKVIGGFSYLQEEFCGYTRVDFKDTTNAFFGKAKVEWKFGDGESGGLFKQPHNFKSSNTYLVESIVTAVSGCSDTSYRNVPVFVRSIPAVQIGGDTVSCTGKDLKLQAFVKSQDSITLQKWITSNGSIVYGDTYKNIYAQPASYIFSFISGTKYGCYDTTKVTLNIYPTPIVKAAPDVTICQGNSITINATGADTYSWYPSEGLSCINCKDPVASPDKATPYTVKGTTKYGCYAYDTILVKVIPKIKIEATKNDSICIGESLQLLASGAKYYEWSPSIGLSATDIQNPIASPTRTTRYRVVGFDEYSCFRDTAFVLIGVGGYPKVDLGPDQLLATGSLFQLKPKFTEGPIKTWSWGPDKDLSCINCASPIARVRNQITYFVTATNYYGCSGSDTISIKVFCENAQVYIPNAFTPDNDGNNDIFMVRASGIQEVKSFRIFNRWGELLFDKANFQPNDPSFAWDGRIRGVIPGPDVFVYTVEVICDDGTPYFYKGNVSLLK